MADEYCYCETYSYPYREERRKAKKPHKCGECRGVIAPGETYLYATGRCEGDWFQAKVCARCTALHDWVQAHVPCLCVEFGNMIEDLMSIAERANREAPGLWFGAARRKVLIDRHRERDHA